MWKYGNSLLSIKIKEIYYQCIKKYINILKNVLFHIIKGYATKHKNADGSQHNTILNFIHHH